LLCGLQDSSVSLPIPCIIFIQVRVDLFTAHQCESRLKISSRSAFAGGPEPALSGPAYALFISQYPADVHTIYRYTETAQPKVMSEREVSCDRYIFFFTREAIRKAAQIMNGQASFCIMHTLASCIQK